MDSLRAREIMKILQETHPGALWHKRNVSARDSFRILIMTILSAQTTDSAVDKVSRRLFTEFPTPEALAAADISRLEEILHSLGFYRVKARHVRDAARLLLKNFGGRVPDRMADLLTLPGVGRKTGNIVLYHAFGINEGVAVDTHVKRLAWRLGITRARTQEGVERDLMSLLPREAWGDITDLLIAHGRQICTARHPKCHVCPLSQVCLYFRENREEIREEVQRT